VTKRMARVLVDQTLRIYSAPSRYFTPKDEEDYARKVRRSLSAFVGGLLTSWRIEFVYRLGGGYPDFLLHYRDVVTRLGDRAHG